MRATVALAPESNARFRHTIRRMRPALGTLVAIEAAGDSPSGARAAVTEAFASITQLATVLHPRGPESELGRINGSPPGTAVVVSRPTWKLLALASRLHTLTGGVFDPCLPDRPGRVPDLELTAGQRVIAHAPVSLDFGGFAKGYAVDCAIDVLIRHGCAAGLVNAGGDLRVFGPAPYPVLLRRRDADFEPITLRDAALAVSDAASQGHPAEHQGYYNRQFPEADLSQREAAVVATTAVLADALTKCVMLCPQPAAARVLQAFGASQPPLQIERSFGERA